MVADSGGDMALSGLCVYDSGCGVWSVFANRGDRVAAVGFCGVSMAACLAFDHWCMVSEFSHADGELVTG